MMKKIYKTAKAEIIRFEAKDIITLSGFFGAEVSFKSSKSISSETTIDWNDFGKE